MKRKQFAKGMEQIAREGAIQIFFYPGTGMERVVVGVVGMLQYDVLEHRMLTEYGVKYRKMDMPHSLIRYIDTPELDPSTLKLSDSTIWVKDVHERDLLIFDGEWAMRWAKEKNPTLVLREFNTAEQ